MTEKQDLTGDTNESTPKDDIDSGTLGQKNPSEIDIETTSTKETVPAGEPRLVIENANEDLMIDISKIQQNSSPQKNMHTENELLNDENNFAICNCKDEEKFVATHYCNDCGEGYCFGCVAAHQRLKATRYHELKRINCNCQDENKFFATKYCEKCTEPLCTDCIVAHQRLKATRNHMLKAI